MNIELNPHGQPSSFGINFRNNRRKAFDTLKGLLKGITADKKLNNAELAYLTTWLADAWAIRNHKTTACVAERIDNIVSDRVIDDEERSELLYLCTAIAENPVWLDVELGCDEHQVDELVGIACGILADGIVNDQEIRALDRWFRMNPAACQRWPGSELASTLRMILADGVITEDERSTLTLMLEDLTGNPMEHGAVSGLSSGMPLDHDAELDFNGTAFCFTGRFQFGTRSKCEEAVRLRGGTIMTGIKRDLDYLVVGLHGSRDWRHTTFGNKILKAVDYREKHGRPLAIVSEDLWVHQL
ncbi:BRCT domain-containing protein [Gallaecimonas sp. GXIMD4217]|uniref:BRCT domain-containing protein n=1 Tax=Gallaecimonas sp. GXIMD4217 TaxID=3131927 RepID=UPI00311AFA18